MLFVNGKPLDDPKHPYIVAEMSGNHAQDYETASRLVSAAAWAGADAVKVQSFVADDLCADVPILFGHDAFHDAWCQRLGVTRLRELFAKGGLPRDWHAPLKQLAEDLGLTFLSTPFSLDAARFLVDEIGVPALKIASGDLTFTPLLQYASSTGLPLIVSTGGATLEECRIACEGPLEEAWMSERLALLHCVSSYPAMPTMMNLRCLTTLARELDVPVGLSDHTLSLELVPAVACMLGCPIFEKHIKFTGDMMSVDAGHALDPVQFAVYVRTIRDMAAVLGDGVKRPQPEEMHDKLWAARDPSDWLRPKMRGRLGDWT